MNIAVLQHDEKVYYVRCFLGLLKPKITQVSDEGDDGIFLIKMPLIPENSFFTRCSKKYNKRLEKILTHFNIEKTYTKVSDASQRYFVACFKDAIRKAAKMHKILLENADIAIVCSDTNNPFLQTIVKDISLLTRFAVLLTEHPESGESFGDSIYESYGYPLFISQLTNSRDNFDIVILLERPSVAICGKIVINLTGEIFSAQDSLVIQSLVIQSDEIECLRKIGISDELIYQIALDCGLENVKIIDFR